MSRYTTSTVNLSASISSLAQAANTEFAALIHGMCSTAAVDLGTQIAETAGKAVPDTVSTRALVDRTLPDWQLYLDAPTRDGLESALAGELPLAGALDAVASSLASLERLAVVEAAARALPSLDYDIVRVDGEYNSAIEARRGDETLLVVVGPQGHITSDHAGLADDSCTTRQVEFVEAMAREGVLLGDQATIQHHDPRGGSSIAAAAGVRADSLAAGAVIGADERHVGLLQSLRGEAPRTRRVVDAGGAR